MKYSLSLLLLFLLKFSNAQINFQFGVNLDGNGAFVNMVNHTNRYNNAIAFDSLGWPMSDFDLVLLDGRPVAEWSGTIDDPEKYRIDYSGTYKCSFEGSANLILGGISAIIDHVEYDTIENKTYFDLIISGNKMANHGLVTLNFSSTRRTLNGALGTGITNLKVNRPGYDLNSTKIFTDEYINLCKAADFACFRFYNVQNIWEGEPVFPTKRKWEGRKTPSDASQMSMVNTNGKKDGWCWEYIIELANRLNKDIWINIHMSCDSEYVHNLASKLKSELNASIKIYVENSNEVWSPTQATHGPYNKAEADSYGITFDQNYARRSVELSNWFAAVFGKNEINKRIRVILAGQHSYNARTDLHLNYINDKIGPPKEYIYATSMALYFTSTRESSANPVVINEGMLEDIEDQISNLQSSLNRQKHINKVKTWDLAGGCTSYEGGPHVPSGGGTTNLDNQILAHRTTNMQKVLEKNYLEGWKNLGGGLAMYFTLNSGYNRYGCWGLTDDYNLPDRNHKMQAARNIIAGKSSVSVKNVPVSELRFYPNPVGNVLNIYFKTEQEKNLENGIQIFDGFGKLVYTVQKVESVNREINLDLSFLDPGLYLLKAGGAIQRIVKK
ncbi:MAG: T9SS type A sorting domain-containing protein [Flavobacteriales bacterium]|nr:T9SS type A sorting domain-containing protein [Flavobacteriales bacterium]